MDPVSPPPFVLTLNMRNNIFILKFELFEESAGSNTSLIFLYLDTDSFKLHLL